LSYLADSQTNKQTKTGKNITSLAEVKTATDTITTKELAYLRGALEKKAGQALWDCGSEVTDSLKKLTAF